MFLRVVRDKAIQQEAIVDVTYKRDLGPAVRPVGGRRHQSMTAQQLKYRLLLVFHPKCLQQCRALSVPSSRARSTNPNLYKGVPGLFS